MTSEKRNALTQSIRSITDAISLPYFEVRVFQKHTELFTYVEKPAQWADKDKLYLYSCTKPVTAVCALQLIEQGKLSLEDPVANYIPAFQNREIKLLHLLTMTAGLSYDFQMPSLKKLLESQENPSTAAIIDAIAEAPLLFAPGTQFCYSFCMDVVARVVEVVSGLRFSDFVQRNVFTPLEMTSCTFRDTL